MTGAWSQFQGCRREYREAWPWCLVGVLRNGTLGSWQSKVTGNHNHERSDTVRPQTTSLSYSIVQRSTLTLPACLISHLLPFPFKRPEHLAKAQYVTSPNGRRGAFLSPLESITSLVNMAHATVHMLRRSTSSTMIRFLTSFISIDRQSLTQTRKIASAS